MTAVAPVRAAVEVGLAPLRLDVGDDELASLRATLEPVELARAARFVFRRDSDRFVAGRGLLRRILARLVDCTPAAVRFEYGAAGKPSLAAAPELRFNLAHSDGAGLVAFARGAELGVDLELPRPGFGGADIARQFFCAAEVEELLRLPEEQRDAAFLRIWTRKEAYVKALGDGLQVPLDRFAVTAGVGEQARMRWCARRGEAERWCLADVSAVVPGATAAVCVEAHEVRTAVREELAWPS
jgi:4'-phosphopantetheinyl transferase